MSIRCWEVGYVGVHCLFNHPLTRWDIYHWWQLWMIIFREFASDDHQHDDADWVINDQEWSVWYLNFHDTLQFAGVTDSYQFTVSWGLKDLTKSLSVTNKVSERYGVLVAAHSTRLPGWKIEIEHKQILLSVASTSINNHLQENIWMPVLTSVISS